MQGWRNTMEDSHIACLDLGNGVAFYGVYDGHGGNTDSDHYKLYYRQWSGRVCEGSFGWWTQKVKQL